MTSAETALVAPTILKALGLKPKGLDLEGTPELPGLPFNSPNDGDE